MSWFHASTANSAIGQTVANVNQRYAVMVDTTLPCGISQRQCHFQDKVAAFVYSKGQRSRIKKKGFIPQNTRQRSRSRRQHERHQVRAKPKCLSSAIFHGPSLIRPSQPFSITSPKDLARFPYIPASSTSCPPFAYTDPVEARTSDFSQKRIGTADRVLYKLWSLLCRLMQTCSYAYHALVFID